jgi:signal transduction histidine kinase/ActR/RegA family two-component response regulator
VPVNSLASSVDQSRRPALLRGSDSLSPSPLWLDAVQGARGAALSVLLRWGVPLLLTLLALLLTEALRPLLTPGRFLLFLTAVVVSAWCGGFRSGLFATALGALGHIYLLLPLHASLGSMESRSSDLLLFLPVALLVSGLIGALHATRREARLLAKALHERVLELTEAHRRKDEFQAVLGHELRNPLGAICHALQVLHLRDDAATVLWTRDVMDRQVKQLRRLVDDLLDNSRVTRGRVLLHREPLDLIQLVRETLADHASEIEGASLALSKELSAGPAWVEGDAARLTQVLSNLLHNAIKFTDPGGQLTVRLDMDAERGRAVVTVCDTGIGIEAAVLPRLFDNYVQERRGRDRGGLGLGLGLVRALIELHGGEVSAASAGLGRGAEFSFWLPLALGPGVVPAGRVAPPGRMKKALRILVIEDDHDSAQTLKILLGLFGHEACVAHSGPAALALARQCWPDVVLCDLGLPGMDGFTLAQALRKEPATAAARLIALSGYTSDEDQRRAREAGFYLYLTKPVDGAELERLLACVPPHASRHRPDSRAGGEEESRWGATT